MIQKKFNLHFFSIRRTPFDWKTLHGYPFAWLIQCATVFSTFFVVCPNVCLSGCMSWLVIMITKDVKSDLQHLNVPGRSIRSQTKAKKNFFIILKFYLGLKELSAKRNYLNSAGFNFILILMIGFSDSQFH